MGGSGGWSDRGRVAAGDTSFIDWVHKKSKPVAQQEPPLDALSRESV